MRQLLTVTSIFVILLLSFTCAQTPRPKFTTEQEATTSRVLQGGQVSTRPLRLYVYDADAISFLNSNTAIKASGEIVNRNLDKLKKYFLAYFKVSSPDSMTTPATSCSGLNILSMNSSSDYHLYLKVENTPNGAEALSSAACLRNTDSNPRPILGVVFINYAVFATSLRDEYGYFHAMVKEMFHLFGFNSSTFQNFPVFNSANNTWGYQTMQTASLINGKWYYRVVIPDVVARAKTFYNCADITGLPLENGGGAGFSGAHWDKLWMGNEVMVAKHDAKAVISEFTLAVLRATGWWIIDEGGAQDYTWGKGDGCSHWQECPASSTSFENCQNAGSAQCSADYTNTGTCLSDTTLLENCKIKVAKNKYCNSKFASDELYNDPTETIANESRCFEWQNGANAVTAKCHTSECTGSGIKITLQDGKVFTCTSGGQRITVSGSDQIVCPDVSDFCGKFDQRCDSWCTSEGNGICMKGKKCLCFFGENNGQCVVNPYAGMSITNGQVINIKRNSFIALPLVVLALLALLLN